MTEAFQTVLRMSFSASWLILAILFLRLLLRRIPKWGNVLLWGLAGLRLLAPITVESRFSLIPETFSKAEVPVMGNWELLISDQAASINPGIQPDAAAGLDPVAVWGILWIIGILGFGLYFAVSYFRFTRRFDTAVLLRENIYQSDVIDTSVVIGLLRPRICVPFQTDETRLKHMIAHERCHIRRGDHWWKLLAYTVLMLHWFNPLVWIAYWMFGRDIELACDEAVVRCLSQVDRAEYAGTLVAYSIRSRTPNYHPLCFGALCVKSRVKAVLGYQHAGIRHYILLAAATLVLGCCFLTSPASALEIPVEDPVIQDAQQPEEETEPRPVKDLTGLELEKGAGNQQNPGFGEKPGDLEFEFAVRRQLELYEKQLEYLKLELTKAEEQYQSTIPADRPPLRASMDRFAYLIEQLEARIQLAKEQLGMQ